MVAEKGAQVSPGPPGRPPQAVPGTERKGCRCWGVGGYSNKFFWGGGYIHTLGYMPVRAAQARAAPDLGRAQGFLLVGRHRLDATHQL